MTAKTTNAINLIPIRTDACPTMGDYAWAKKMNVTWANRKKGDVVLFDFNKNGTSDHIGIVISVNSDGSITTIEGNTDYGNDTNGGQVQKRTRYKYQVNFLVRPKYTKEITADMVIATAKAELGVKESPKDSNKVKYNVWYYGKNMSAAWCCTFVCWVFAHVLLPEVINPISKPTTKYTGNLPTPTLEKGSTGNAVKLWQKFLNWFGNFGLVVDGDFGDKTAKATKVFQKTMGLEVDGIVGTKTINKAKPFLAPVVVTKVTSTPAVSATPKADKLVATAKDLAWPKGTAVKYYSYKKKTGAPTAKMKKAMQKRGYGDTKDAKKNRIAYTDCGYCQNTVIFVALGITTKVLRSNKESFPKVSGFDVVFEGKKIPSGVLKPGDIIRYKKKSGSQHVLMYIGNNDLAEGGRKVRFFVIKHFPQISKAKFNKANVKKSTLEVLRAKE